MGAKTKKFLSEYYHFLFLAILFLLEVAIVWNVDLYGDDFYYANFTQEGFKYFVSENVFHYTMTNGRCWIHLLDELLLCGGSIVLWRIFQPFAITALVYFGSRLVSGKDNERFRISVVLISLSFTLIGILNAGQSIYWATGSMNYYLPALLMVCLAYFLKKSYEDGKLPVYVIVLAFFSCSSTEQCAFASFAFVLLYLVLNLRRNRRVCAKDVILLVLSLAAVLALFLAPGNGVREGYYPEFYGMPLFRRITENFRPLCELVFSQSGIGSFVMLFFVSGILSFKGIRNNTFVLVLVLSSSVGLISLFSYMFLLQHIALLVLTICCLAIESVYFAVIWSKEGKIDRVALLIMAYVMQGAMLLSPIFGPRTTLASGLLIMLISVMNMLDSPSFMTSIAAVVMTVGISSGIWYVALASLLLFFVIGLNLEKKIPAAIPALLVIAAVLIVRNQTVTLMGYAENHRVIKENYRLIEEYKRGDEGILEQHYLVNGYYKYTMPYESSYHEWWYKKLNGIGEEVPIKYTSFE